MTSDAPLPPERIQWVGNQDESAQEAKQTLDAMVELHVSRGDGTSAKEVVARLAWIFLDPHEIAQLAIYAGDRCEDECDVAERIMEDPGEELADEMGALLADWLKAWGMAFDMEEPLSHMIAWLRQLAEARLAERRYQELESLPDALSRARRLRA